MLKAIGLIALLTFVVHAEFVEEDNIIVLTDENFKEVLDLKYVLVEFYAPWCGHCKALAPEYAKAAAMLKEEGSNIRLAKVDATVNLLISEKHEVRGYPTLKFFRKGSAIDFKGGRSAPEIINWVKRKTEPPSKTIHTADDINEFKKSANVVVIGYFENVESNRAKTFVEVADSVEGVPFAISSEHAVKEALGFSKDGIILYKNFDERETVFKNKLTVETLKSFVSENRLPLVIEFNQKTASEIFGGEIKTHHLLFISKDSDDYDSIHSAFKKVAQDYKGKMLFVQINIADQNNMHIVEYFALKTKDIPTSRIVVIDVRDITKYKPEFTKMTAENIAEFTTDFVAGKLKRHRLSEDVPEDWDKNPVKVLVGKNFNKVALDKTKNVLVKFYAPWCGHCKQLIPVWEELAKKYADDENVIIAKLDATTNEIEEVKIQSFPTIKFFPAGSDKIIDFTGKRTLEGLSEFIDAGGEVNDEEFKEAQPEEEIKTTEDGHDEL